VDLADDPDRDSLLGRRQRRSLASEAGTDHQYVMDGHGRALYRAEIRRRGRNSNAPPTGLKYAYMVGNRPVGGG
jgi:hypothetical protein